MSLLLCNFIFLFYFINYSAAKICASRHMGIYSDYFLEVASVKENKTGMYKWSSCSFHLVNYFQDSASVSSLVFLYSLINPNGMSLEVKKDDYSLIRSIWIVVLPYWNLKQVSKIHLYHLDIFFRLLITVIKLFLEMLTQFTLPLV